MTIGNYIDSDPNGLVDPSSSRLECPLHGKLEVSRLLKCLNLDLKYFSKLVTKLTVIRNVLQKNVRYRDPMKLAPIVIYLYYRYMGVYINKEELLRHSHLSRKYFEAFVFQILRYEAKVSRKTIVGGKKVL